MAEKEHGRLRPTFAELLSPSAVLQTARGTLTDHDEPNASALTKAAELDVLTTLSQLMQGQAPMPAAAALYK